MAVMREYLYNLATDKEQGFAATILKLPLLLLSFAYGLFVCILSGFNRLFACKINAKVISVGNITLGGTGKTILVELIAQYLKQEGRKTAVLTRGYGRQNDKMGDEPLMLQEKLIDVPLIVDADRIRGANRAIFEFGADTLVMDDSMQQWKIKKDLEIVAVDAGNPFGNGHLLPRGILREPKSALSRADVFVLTKTNLAGVRPGIKEELKKINPRADIFDSIHEPVGFFRLDQPDQLLGLGLLKGRKAAAFCGIGDPESFKKLIAGLGVEVIEFLKFQDHYNYTAADLEAINKSAMGKKLDIIVTTEKDAARLKGLWVGNHSLMLLVLKIAIKIKDDQRFFARLRKLYSL